MDVLFGSVQYILKHSFVNYLTFMIKSKGIVDNAKEENNNDKIRTS